MLPYLCSLYGIFLKIGLFTIGGGYAMIPLMEREIITRHGWLTAAEFLDIVAVAEVTPGPLAINAATFIGYRLGGFGGAMLASLGVITLPGDPASFRQLPDAIDSGPLRRALSEGLTASPDCPDFGGGDYFGPGRAGRPDHGPDRRRAFRHRHILSPA